MSRAVSAILLLAMVSFAGCGPGGLRHIIMLDTPEVHTQNGYKLLDAGKLEAADREFVRALELDPGFAPALIGNGLVAGFNEDFSAGLEKLEAARKTVSNALERQQLHVGYMRIYLMGRDKLRPDWLRMVEANFQEAAAAAPLAPAPYFFMGLAYKLNFEFQKAVDMFNRVVELDRHYAPEARFEIRVIRKIEKTPQ